MIDLRLGNCQEVMKGIPDCCIDMVITSPPYDNLRTYEGISEWNESVWQITLAEIFRVLKEGRCCIWIVNDATVKGTETLTSFKQALFAKSIGFNVHDTMIWYKRAGGHIFCPQRYIPSFEYMFVFTKGKIKTCNLIFDRKNIHYGEVSICSNRLPDGITKPKTHKKIKEFGKRYNVWEIEPVQSNKERTGHPAQFPIEIVKDHILTWSDKGETILDPFCGSGTTAEACIITGRNFIGCEINENYYKIALRRIEKAKRIQDHLLFLDLQNG